MWQQIINRTSAPCSNTTTPPSTRFLAILRKYWRASSTAEPWSREWTLLYWLRAAFPKHLPGTQQQFRSNTALTVAHPHPPTPGVPFPTPTRADGGRVRSQWLEQGEKQDDWQWRQPWEGRGVGGHIVLQWSRIANDGWCIADFLLKAFFFSIFKLMCILPVWPDVPLGGSCCACLTSTD